jgi:hypothetical protein
LAGWQVIKQGRGQKAGGFYECPLPLPVTEGNKGLIPQLLQVAPLRDGVESPSERNIKPCASCLLQSFQLSNLQTSNSSKKTGGCKQCINHRIQKLGGNPRDLGQKLLPFSSLSATSDSAKKTPNPLQYVALKTEMVLL